MRWRKLGLVWGPDGSRPWARTHAILPTPHRLNDEVIRVYVAGLDGQGRGRTGFVDLAAADPTRVLAVSPEPLWELGAPGTFDDNGAIGMSLVAPAPGLLYFYYAGFELCSQVPYRILTGLAISEDGGTSFRRHGAVPVLERSTPERYFRTAPFVWCEAGRYHMYYAAGSAWTEIGGKPRPIYDLRHIESPDGIRWPAEGRPLLRLTDPDEHGFGRPWIVRRGPADFQLFFSVRRRSLGAYRLGYAESGDGLTWQRKDAALGLDVSPGGFDSQAISYAAVISAKGRTWCFYNGNDFGREGFAVAELLA